MNNSTKKLCHPNPKYLIQFTLSKPNPFVTSLQTKKSTWSPLFCCDQRNLCLLIVGKELLPYGTGDIIWLPVLKHDLEAAS